MMRFFCCIIIILFTFNTKASQLLGGEITWQCQAGQYIFTLTIYRDCNQADVSTTSQTLRVWNHPTLKNIEVDYVSREDISPFCTQVAGSPGKLACGTGNNGGNGLGAIEKIIYKSDPINISGIPSNLGWNITFDDFPRNVNISNLSSPANHGMTIAATIYKSQNGQCIYDSPRFLENPNFIIVKGKSYHLNMNAYSPVGDSISYELANPLNNIANNTFNPPTDPSFLSYNNDFSYTSPTPNTTFDAGNQPFSLDINTGEITFLSNTTGAFVCKILVSNYLNHTKLGSIQREFIIFVVNDNNYNNNAPIITSTPTIVNSIIDVVVGNVVNLTLNTSDVELLQDGTAQNVTILASGTMFGTNYTSTSGCNQPPCATLSQTLPITFNGNNNLTFNWQTDCKHLLTNGNMQNKKAYTFVFMAKDDYCQVPGQTYKTIQINVHSTPNSIPKITCVQGQSDSSFIVTVENTNNINLPYYIKDNNDNIVAIINSSTQTNISVPKGNYTDFYISFSPQCMPAGTYVSGTPYKIINLILNNPQNGTAFLQWNNPSDDMSDYGDYYYIYQEYPTGTWSLLDSVPKNVNSYRDTIEICKAYINYQIGIRTPDCLMKSQVAGDTLKDLIAPAIPIISSVSIDTLSGNAVITWNESSQDDTYGYIIYQTDNFGILQEIDTVFGITDTSFTHITNTSDEALTYSVSAFDHCFTQSAPITFQTSAKAAPNTSIFLQQSFDACSKEAKINWTQYIGWSGNILYKVYAKINNQWIVITTSSATSFNYSMVDLDSCTFFIKGISANGNIAFSNKVTIYRTLLNPPAYHYTKVATVDGNNILLKHYMQVPTYPSELVIQRKEGSVFKEIGRIPVVGEENQYIDSNDINVNNSSYTYRILYTDSCGFAVNPANVVTTILAKINHVDENNMTVNIQWTPYSKFEGGVSRYEIFRAVNGQYQWPAIYTAANNEFQFEDQLDEMQTMTGKVCYRVVAKEGANIYNFNEESLSNEACYVFEPIIYIPNAFTPGGLNPIFKPVINLAQFNHFKMTIFDRWNGIIYQTDDLNLGWDGIMNNGKKAPMDVYGYIISIEDGNGKEIRKTGHVTVIWTK